MKQFKIAVWLLAGLILLGLSFRLLSGCGIKTFSSGRPGIVSVSPADKSFVTDLNTKITATFDKDLDPLTITTSTFTVTASSGAISGAVSYDAASKTAVFTPLSGLSYSSVYTAEISSAVKASDGTSMETPFSWSFMTIGLSGALDTSFGVNGMATGEAGSLGKSMTIDPAGKILIAGQFNGAMAIWRFDDRGVADDSFGPGGVAYDGSSGSGNSIVLDASGRILIAGYRSIGKGGLQMSLWRYGPDGTIDPVFGNSGVVSYSFNDPAYTSWGNSVAVGPGGGIYVCGIIRYSNEIAVPRVVKDQMAIWRFTSDGSLEGVIDYVTDNGSFGNSIAVDAAGKILVAGGIYSTALGIGSQMAIWRYNSDGTVDEGFGGGGVVEYGSLRSEGNALAVDPSGRILVAGHSADSGGANYITVWRYDSKGSIDTSFGAGGLAASNTQFKSPAQSIALDISGKILTTGFIYMTDIVQMFIWRCDSDGTTDAAFGNNGRIAYESGSNSSAGKSIAVDSSGRILVAGEVDPPAEIGPPYMAVWGYK